MAVAILEPQTVSQQPTLPKPEKRLTTDAVMSAIREYIADRSAENFTTMDIARHMGIDEYPVRAAVSWLARYGRIEIIPGVRSKRYRSPVGDRRLHGDHDFVSVCRVKEAAAPVDFAALNPAFGFA